MAERIFALPHSYPDFPLDKRRSKSPKSPGAAKTIGEEVRDIRGRERLPPPLKAMNQVRFRQFKKQIENIRKISYDLPKRDSLGKSLPDLSGKLKQAKAVESGGLTERKTTVGAFPRTDLHRQVLSLVNILKAACAGLELNFQVASGDLGDWRYAGVGPCPLCQCTCSHRAPEDRTINSAIEAIVDIHLESKRFVTRCSHCGDNVLTALQNPQFVCDACLSGNETKPAGDTVSLFVDIRMEDATRGRRTLDAHSKSHHDRKSLNATPPLDELRILVNDTPLPATVGSDMTLRLVLSRVWTGEGKPIAPPLTPSFSPAPDFPSEPARPRQFDVSFGQNFLTALQSPPQDHSDKSFFDQIKLLHTETEYVLTDHIQFAAKHQYVFEVTDVCESYIIQYLNLMRRAWKVLMPYSPECVSILEMSVKGLVLVFETTLASFRLKTTALEKQLANSKKSVELQEAKEKLRQASADLSFERSKTEKLEHSLTNAVRNYEEMIAMYHRDQLLPKPKRSASARRHTSLLHPTSAV